MNVAAAGGAGCVLMTTLTDPGEVHPAELVTVKLYVPATSPDTFAVAPEPAIAPGLIVQFPAGRLNNAALPVPTAHVGWVTVPTIGAVGVTGCALITILAVAGEVHPSELVTV